MRKYTNGLLSAAVIIGLTASSSAFADSIHGALQSNQVASETVVASTSATNHDATLWTIQDYVDNFRATNGSDEANAIAVDSESAPRTIQDYVDNYRASLEAIKG